MPEYEVTFGDEHAEDLVDDPPVPELSNRELYCSEHLLAMLHAINTKNPGKHFEYVSKPDVLGLEVDSISFVHSWHLVSAWKHSSIVVMYCLLLACY
jgi:hypothetical protein